MRIIGDRSNLFRGVNRSHFRGLGNRHDLGLNMVLVPHSMKMASDSFNRNFPIRRGNSQQFATGKFLGSSTLVHINVSSFGAKNRIEGLRYDLQPQNIGARSTKNKVDIDPFSKMLLEFLDGSLCVVIVSIRLDMSGISQGNGP